MVDKRENIFVRRNKSKDHLSPVEKKRSVIGFNAKVCRACLKNRSRIILIGGSLCMQSPVM